MTVNHIHNLFSMEIKKFTAAENAYFVFGGNKYLLNSSSADSFGPSLSWESYHRSQCDGFMKEVSWKEEFIFTMNQSSQNYAIASIQRTPSDEYLLLFQYDGFEERYKFCIISASSGLLPFSEISDDIDLFTEIQVPDQYDCDLFMEHNLNSSITPFISRKSTPDCIYQNTSSHIGDFLCYGKESDYYYECSSYAQMLFTTALHEFPNASKAYFVFDGDKYAIDSSSISSAGPSIVWEAYHHSECNASQEVFWNEEFVVTMNHTNNFAVATVHRGATGQYLMLFQYDGYLDQYKFCAMDSSGILPYSDITDDHEFLAEIDSVDQYGCETFIQGQEANSTFAPFINRKNTPDCVYHNTTIPIKDLLCYGKDSDYYYECSPSSESSSFGLFKLALSSTVDFYSTLNLHFDGFSYSLSYHTEQNNISYNFVNYHHSKCEEGSETDWEELFILTANFSSSYAAAELLRTPDDWGFSIFEFDGINNKFCYITEKGFSSAEDVPVLSTFVSDLSEISQYDCGFFYEANNQTTGKHSSLISRKGYPSCTLLNTSSLIRDDLCYNGQSVNIYECSNDAPNLFAKALNETLKDYSKLGFVFDADKFLIYDPLENWDNNWSSYHISTCGNAGQTDWEEVFSFTTQLNGSYGMATLQITPSTWSLAISQYDKSTNLSSYCYVDENGAASYAQMPDDVIFIADIVDILQYDCNLFFILDEVDRAHINSALITKKCTPMRAAELFY